jgi:hypothetical protein
MRFMLLMIPRVYQGVEARKLPANFAPDAASVAKMMRFNERLVKAGALVAGEGLRPPSEGARVEFGAGKAQVKSIPAAGHREQLGGYWIIRAGSREEAVRWVTECPAADGDVIEVREVFEEPEAIEVSETLEVPEAPELPPVERVVK